MLCITIITGTVQFCHIHHENTRRVVHVNLMTLIPQELISGAPRHLSLFASSLTVLKPLFAMFTINHRVHSARVVGRH
jgi:hypothetical protein